MFRLGRDCLCRKEAPRLGRLQSPLCWRCSGMAVGVVVLLALHWLGALPEAPVLMAVLGSLCGLPAGADVLGQVVSDYRSTSRRRWWSGLLLGASIVLVVQAVLSWVRPLLSEGVLS